MHDVSRSARSSGAGGAGGVLPGEVSGSAKCGGLAKGHHEENPDCTECHMARPPSNDIAHEQVTDHWMQKRE